MASHAFIVSWIMAPSGKMAGKLGTEWSVGFRGQEYENVKGYHQVMSATFTFSGGNVGISPSSADPQWDTAFGGDKLAFCAYYWWNNAWFGGFVDWWPITEGNRTSRDLKNADGQFQTAWNVGVPKFLFVITDMHGKRTNFQEIKNTRKV